MFGVWRYHCSVSPSRGVVGYESIMFVCRPVMMSVAASGTTLKPFAFQMTAILSSPAQMNILVLRRPSTDSTGCLVKKYTQPPWPHDSSTKPFSSRRCLSVGSSLLSVA